MPDNNERYTFCFNCSTKNCKECYEGDEFKDIREPIKKEKETGKLTDNDREVLARMR